MDLKELRKEASDIQEFLEITTSNEIEEIVERGNALTVYIARTGKMLADAKYYQQKAIRGEIMNIVKQLNDKLPASTINELIKASCEKENYLVSWFERMNRTATHQLDWCRTLISKAKEEMKNL